jgi:hypothetical protein
VDVHEPAAGFSYWMAPHPAWEPTDNWPEEVLCVYLEAPDGIVLIDPLLPRAEDAEFWHMLDGAVERTGQPVRVLLTSPWHARDTPAVVGRYRPGDVFSGTGGRFHVLGDDPGDEAFHGWLPNLYELSVERVLIAHGEPVLADGAARIRDAVAEAQAFGRSG